MNKKQPKKKPGNSVITLNTTKKELSDLLTSVPVEILGEIRANVSLYQTEQEWLQYRVMADMLIYDIQLQYPDVAKFLVKSVMRIADVTQRYAPYDICDNLNMCNKCVGYKFECSNYIRNRFNRTYIKR